MNPIKKKQFSAVVRDEAELQFILVTLYDYLHGGAAEAKSVVDGHFEELMIEILPKCFAKLINDDSSRYWSPDSSVHIQHRNVEFVRIIATLLKG